MCGLAHYGEEIARRCGQRAINLWHKLVPEARALIQKVVRELLDGNLPFRAGIDLFIAGGFRSEWTIVLKIKVACLAFIPVFERIIEAQHRLIGKHTAAQRAGGQSVSLSKRCAAV